MTALVERDLDGLPVARNGRKPTLRPSDATNHAGTETGRHTLSHTRLSVFLACHRKFDLEYLERLEPIVEPRYFGLGKAYQKAIEFQDPEVGVRFLNGFEPCDVCGGETDQVQTFDGPPPCEACHGRGYVGEQLHFHTQEAEDRHRVDEAIVRAASKLYLRTWPVNAVETREFEYRVQLRSPWTGAYSHSYDLLGYADALVDPTTATAPHYDPAIHESRDAWRGEVERYFDDLRDRPLEIIENKLVGRIEKTQILSLPLNRQLALERYGIWRATGRPVTRVWYRWVKKPSIRQREGRKKDRSDAETIDQFVERIEQDYEERPDFYAHQEDPRFIGTGDLLRIEAELWEWAEDVRSRMRPGPGGRRRVFDRDTTRCSEYGGCQFIPICTGDPDARSLFRVREPRTISSESAPEAE